MPLGADPADSSGPSSIPLLDRFEDSPETARWSKRVSAPRTLPKRPFHVHLANEVKTDPRQPDLDLLHFSPRPTEIAAPS